MPVVTKGTAAVLRPVTVFAALGPNPAPLSELIWALHRRRDLVTTDLFLVVDERGHDYLHDELLGERGALRELSQVLGLSLGPEAIRAPVVRGPEGVELDDDDPEHAALYDAAVWETARQATEHAGSGTVVFGLTAGRRRTMTAMSTAAFQLLARSQDLCLDVRVSDRRVEGGSGFFFPEQSGRFILTPHGMVDAREVDVRLVEVRLPRLGSLLEPNQLTSYESALEAGQRVIEAARPPRLVVDLEAGKILVNDEDLELSLSQFVWYACLAWARTKPGDGWVSSKSASIMGELGAATVGVEWRNKEPKPSLLKFLDTLEVDDDDQEALSTNRAKTAAAVRAWCRKHRPAYLALLEPEPARSGGEWHQRLPLESSCIHVLHARSKPRR